MADEVAIGAGLAKARDSAIDQLGIALGERFIIDTEALRDAGTVFFDDNISRVGQLEKGFFAESAFEVKADGAFVAREGIGGYRVALRT